MCMILMDTEREKQIALAPDYPFGTLGPGECVLPSSMQTAYDLEIGS